MPKKDGDITKQRILEVAEKLFSEKGFDAASIDSLSKAAGINKATIYYHFKDKNDIIVSLFQGIISELENRLRLEENPGDTLKDKIKKEINYLRSKRNILSILVMEQTKNNEINDYFFQIGKSVIDSEYLKKQNSDAEILPETRQKYYIHEFFTGLIPVIMYVIFENKWARFFGFNKTYMLDDFIELYENTHLKTHII